MSAAPLLRRWSRRDRLAILLIAITVAFLVGTTIVLVATGAATTEVAAEFGSVGHVSTHESVQTAAAHAGPNSLVVPVASVDGGPATTVVGLPPVSERPSWTTELGISRTPTDAVAVVDPVGETSMLQGEDATVETPITDRTPGLFPDDWGLARESLVDELGPTGALVLSPPGASEAADAGAPLRGAYDFFSAGNSQVLAALAIVVVGVGLLVAVVVFGAVRTSARARRRSIFVIRATGGTRRRVLAAFALRGTILTTLGVALGYALGVIAINVAVNAGVAIGLSTSLSATVRPTAAWLLLAMAVLVVGIGTIAGLFAARPVASKRSVASGSRGEHAPAAASASERRSTATRLRQRLGPQLLSLRALVPMVVTLSSFVVIALLLVAGATAAAPLSAGGGTIVQPGAPHPMASAVPSAYADAIEDDGGAASPEILAFTVVDGSPTMVRGARYDAFASVTDARLTRGERPSGPKEAIVGADLARTLELDVGEHVTVGGSTRPAVASVEVVGVYRAPGPYDDALLVSPGVARHLAGVPPNAVHFIRTAGLDAAASGSANLTVVSVDAPRVVPHGAAVNVSATVLNPSASSLSGTFALSVDDEQVSHSDQFVSVASLSSRNVRFTHTFDRLGNRTVAVGDRTQSVTVVAPDTPRLAGFPDAVPVGSEPSVTVRTVTERPVTNATISVGERTFRTDQSGRARLDFTAAGNHQVVVTANGHRLERTVTVGEDVPRSLVGTVDASPQSPSLLTRPTARLHLSNPWNVSRTSDVTLIAADDPVLTRTVTLAPGESTTLSQRLERRAPGTYELELTVDGDRTASTNVTVQRNARLSSALATTDAAVPGGGLGGGVEMVLGNLTILAGTLGLFAGLLAVGSVAFGLASGVFGRRRTVGIHRATGAGPLRILGLLVADGLRLAAVAVPVSLAIGLGALLGLSTIDRLVFFGVRVDPVPRLPVLGAIAVGSVLVVVISVLVVGVAVVRPSPGALLTGDVAATRGGEDGRPPLQSDGTERRRSRNEDGPRVHTGGEDDG